MLFGELKLEPESLEFKPIKDTLLTAEILYKKEDYTGAREKLESAEILDDAWDLPDPDRKVHTKIVELINLFFELHDKLIAEFHS